MGDVGDFVAVAAPSVAVACVMYLIFCCCRKRFPAIYEPRATKALPNVKFEQAIRALPEGFAAWVAPLLRLPASLVAETAGTNAAGYVVFQRTMFELLVVLSLLCLAVLLSVYGTGEQDLPGFRRVSLANVDQKSARLWASALALWAVALLVLAFFYRGLRQVVDIRMAENRRACRWWHSTVLVRRVPEDSRTAEAIRAHFEGLFPGRVHSVHPVRDMGGDYEKALGEYTVAWRGLQRALAAVDQNPGAGPPMTRRQLLKLPIGGKVEAVPHFTARCEELRPKIEEARAAYDTLGATSSAFVTLTSLAAAVEAQQGAPWGAKAWICGAAPDPRDVVWSTLVKDRSVAARRGILVGICAVVLLVCLLFAPVVAFTQALVNLEELARQYSWLRWINDIPGGFVSIVQGFLPAAILSVYTAVVVPVFTFLARQSRVERARDVHLLVMYYVFTFFLTNYFFVVTISGSLFGEITSIIGHPDAIIELLGTSVPSVASFFVYFVTLKALAIAPSYLSLIGPLIVTRIKLRFLCRTDAEREEALLPQHPEMGVNYAWDLFIFTIAITYAVVAPVILPFACLYFFLSSITGKYLVCYVYRTEFQSGDVLMLPGVQLALTGCTLGQLVALFVFALKLAWGPLILASPLPVLTVAFSLWVKKGPARALAEQHLPGEVAAELDSQNSLDLDEPVKQHYWIQPSYSVDLDNPIAERFRWVDVPGESDGSKNAW